MADYEYGGSVFDTNGRQFGNTGNNANQVFGDVTNPTKQKQKTVNNVREFTMSSYRQLYKDLEGLHTSYLTTIKKAEEGHYINLTKGDRSGFIYKQYDDLYKKLEQRHNLYLQRIGGKQGNNTNVALWANPNAQQTGNGATQDVASNAISGGNPSDASSANNALASINSRLDVISANAEAGARNSYAVGNFLQKTDKDNRREAQELKDSIEKATKETQEITKQGKENNRQQKKKASKDGEVSELVLDILNTTNRSVVQNKYLNNLVKDTLAVLKVFQKQESVADSVVSVIMIAVDALFGWLGEALSQVHQTQEETYKAFGLYYTRSIDALHQNALYDQMLVDKSRILAELSLTNNTNSSEWFKLQASLLEKGFSANQSEVASLQSLVLNNIAPYLDTNNQYFLDLQQNGLFQLTKSMGGLVESVRDTAGSSRVTMGSLSTIIDKLAPVELYTKRELMDDTARAYLSALENSGMATADAINLVSDSIEAYYDPYKGMTSGNVLQRVALAQMGGNPESWVDLIGAQIGLADMFTSGTPDALTQGAVNSVLGASWLNARANYGTINQTFLEELEKAMQETYAPADAYEELKEAFAETDLFQMPDELMKNIGANSQLVQSINGAVNHIAFLVAEFVNDVFPTVEETFLTVSDVLLQYFNSKGYTSKMLKKAEEAETEEERIEYAKKAKKSATGNLVKDVLFAPWKDVFTDHTMKETVSELDKDIENLATANVYSGNDWGTEGTGKAILEATPIYQAGKAYKKYMIDKPIEWAKGLFGVDEYGTGGYVSSPQLAVVGDNPYGEVISPIPQLTSAVMRGVNASNKNKPDTSDVEAVIIQVGEAIVKAIAENGGTIVFDNSTGLMSGGSKSSLKPIMGGKGGY